MSACTRFWACLHLAAALGVLAAPAAAQPDTGSAEVEGAKQQAREHFRRGVASFEAGDFVGALEQFQAADAAYPSPVITYNVGRAHESLGHAQQAVQAYERYLAEAGADAEFASAATVAIAQIKGRSTRLRVTSDPPGAVVRVDGMPLQEKTPTTVLLLHGRHRIALELGQWQDGRDYEAAGGGAIDELSFERPEPPAPEPAAPRPATVARDAPRPRPAPERPAPDGLMGAVGLTFSGFAFVNDADQEQTGSETTTSKSRASGVVFGLGIEVGYALGSRTAVLAKGFYGAGSSEKSLASLGAGGLLLGWRFSPDWWLGGGVIAGASEASSDAQTEDRSLGTVSTDKITYRTDLALGPMLELTYALGDSADGQWIVSLQPGTLFTTGSEESTLFVPLVVGHRWF